MLMSEGLRQFVEPHCVQRELSEVTGLTVDELDHAAHELIRRTASDPTSFPAAGGVPSRPAAVVPPTPGSADRPRRPPYYEHLGGYSFDELKDYNRYSPVEQTTRLPLLVGGPSVAAGGDGRTAAAAAAFRAGGLSTRVYHSDDFTPNDNGSDYGGPIYTTSV